MTTAGRPSLTYEIPKGTALGKYEVLRKIATGGMAEIYLARATGTAGFEKVVVLKRILPTVAGDPTFVRMFLDEARLAATLQHPNIADVYDVGESDGMYFFTMEFVHGQDARAVRQAARARGELVPLALSLAIVHGIASALDYAHDKTGPDGKVLGLVHRDISGSNILVSYDGAVKLVDFGIARATTQVHKTNTGTLKGKIPYMSPEQCRGVMLDRRSDLYSLGVVLYELTVGRRPFRGESDFAIMDQIVHQGAVPPAQVVADYPPALDAIVMKLLARDPDHRYATAEQVLHDLEQFMSANGVWASTKSLGKYMRILFGDKIEAWESAAEGGVAFVDHVVANTISSSSQRSDLVTPVSMLYGSQMTGQLVAPPAPISRSQPAVQPLEPPRKRWWIVIGIPLLACGAIGAYLIVADRARETPATAPTAPAAAAANVVPAPVPTPPAAITEPPPAPTPKPTPVPNVVAPSHPPPPRVQHPKPPPPPPKKKKQEEPWDPNSLTLPPQ